MLTVTATDFRANLFKYLDTVAAGEMIVIKRSNKDVARLMPLEQADWRSKIRPKITLNVSPEELMAPLDDWDDYL